MWIGGRDQFENDVYFWLDGTPIDNFVTFWAGDIYLFYYILEWVWIGGRDQFENDVYYWLDGTPIDNFDTFWAGDEPDGANHDYMYIRNNEDWAWADEPDGEKLVLCEYEL